MNYDERIRNYLPFKIFAYGKIKLNKQKIRLPSGILIKKGKRCNASPSAKWPQLFT